MIDKMADYPEKMAAALREVASQGALVSQCFCFDFFFKTQGEFLPNLKFWGISENPPMANPDFII